MKHLQYICSLCTVGICMSNGVCIHALYQNNKSIGVINQFHVLLISEIIADALTCYFVIYKSYSTYTENILLLEWKNFNTSLWVLKMNMQHSMMTNPVNVEVVLQHSSGVEL